MFVLATLLKGFLVYYLNAIFNNYSFQKIMHFLPFYDNTKFGLLFLLSNTLLMQIEFHKYHGTGNDFIIIDNRTGIFPKNDTNVVAHLCDRRFGIGADGLILLENDESSAFKMVYYNSDGNESSMCGNGGRCIVAFAKKLQIIVDNVTFNAIDGLHRATIFNDDSVSLQMSDVDGVIINDNYTFVNTGSPHHIVVLDEIQNLDIKNLGSEIRYSTLYGKVGSNVNFVKQIAENEFSIRTYERGVEDETLSCGTGATAVAIAMHAIKRSTSTTIKINVVGGILEIIFEKNGDNYNNIFLKGATQHVFKGNINVQNITFRN